MEEIMKALHKGINADRYLTTEEVLEIINKLCLDVSIWLQIAYKIAVPFSITVVCWLIFLTVIVLRKRRNG